MGLLYPFPVSAEETDFVQLTLGQKPRIKLKSYGLPYLFWGYALASLTVLLFLWLAVRAPIEKLAQLGGADALLARGVELFIYLLPVVVLGFFFYEKTLEVQGQSLTITHKLFGCALKRHTLQLSASPFYVAHHMDAPNVARLRGGPEAQGFQNKGYFTLWATDAHDVPVAIDRHSRKADLEALAALLSLGLETTDQAR